MFPPSWGIFPPRHMMTEVAVRKDDSQEERRTLTVSWWRLLRKAVSEARNVAARS